MTSPIVDFSEIDLTGSVKFEDQQIGSVYYNGERLWPFGVDLLYTGQFGGASYLPDPADVYGANTLAAFSEGVSAVLDEKNGTPVLGPELVVNGTFETDISGWTEALGAGATITWASGEAILTVGTNGVRGYQVLSTVAGRSYRLRMSGRSITSGSSGYRVSTNSTGSSVGQITAEITISGSWSRDILFVATASTTTIAFVASGSVGQTAAIDNVSVREVPGIHAYQLSASLRPLLGRAPKAGRRNLFERSEEFENAYWNKSNATVSTNTITAPDGTASADLITSTGVDGAVTKVAGAAGTQYTLSVYAKRGNSDWIAFSNAGFFVYFNVQTGVVGTVQNGVASIQSVGDGWYRCSWTPADLSQNGIWRIRCAVSNGSVQTTNQTAYFWGAQLEIGSTAASYQRVGAVTDITEAGVPSYPFVRFDLSDDRLDTAGLRSQKNLLLATEEFDNSAWVKFGCTATPNAVIAPNNEQTAETLVPSGSLAEPHFNQTINLSQAGFYTTSVYLKAGDHSLAYVDCIGWGAGGADRGAYFDLVNGTTPTAGASIVPDVDGWFRCILPAVTVTAFDLSGQVRIFPSQTLTTRNFTTAADAIGKTIHVWGAQFEPGLVATPYEYGGFSGDILVAGRNGSAITPGVKVPDGNVSLGPTSYTGGTPGILRAIGDVVGWSLLRKTMSAAERERLMRFYKRRGAKGLLVPGGPDLMVNGSFDDASGWTLTAWLIEGGVASHTSGAFSNLTRTIPELSVGKTYRIEFDAIVAAGAFIGDLRLGGSTSASTVAVISANGNRRYVAYGTQTQSGTQFTITANASFTGSIDNISVRELRPEEEW
jgi:hypothetical protein